MIAQALPGFNGFIMEVIVIFDSAFEMEGRLDELSSRDPHP